MKPGIFKAEKLGPNERERIVRWMTANGLRHYVPLDAPIIYTGNRLIVPTFDIERVGQRNKKWARHRFDVNELGEIVGLPVKVRTYRVRVPFEAIK